jgi:hypothetical protein
MDGGTGVCKTFWGGATCHQIKKKITPYFYGDKSMIVASLAAIIS